MANSPCHIRVMLGDAVGGLSSWTQNDLIAPLLILVLGMALGIGLVSLILVARMLRQNQGPASQPGLKLERPDRSNRLPQVSLPQPSRWLAVRSHHPRQVQNALGLHRLVPCTWEDGLQEAQDQKLFVSAPVRGWVLVMGAALPDPAEDVDRCFRFVHGLSQKVGRVQYFSMNQTLSHHAWVLASHGKILRAYAWAGQTLWNQGPLTPEEWQLGLHSLDHDEPAGDFDFKAHETAAQNTEKLPLLAERWSLDPFTIDPRWFRQSHGTTGEFATSLTF